METRHPYATSICLLLCWLFLVPDANYAQDPSSMRPQDLVWTDPAAFLKWLQTGRPVPVSPEEKGRILGSLPPRGEITELTVPSLMKLSSLRRVLERGERIQVYTVKVIDVPQAAVGLHARAVLLISEPALALVSSEELQALAAHELGHEYIWHEYQRAIDTADRNRVKELELLCDAIGLATLHRLGIDGSRLATGIDKISRFNRERFGTADNEGYYPTVGERRDYAASIRAWLRRLGPRVDAEVR